MFKSFIYAAAAATFVIAPTFDCAQAAVFNRPVINLPQIPRPTVSVPRPAVNPSPLAGLTATTKITHVGRYTEDTTVYTNKSGKVVMATSSIVTTPTNSAPNSTTPVTPAHNGTSGGSTSGFGGSGLSPNNPITPANAWNAGATQPYNQYTNNGISAANAWNAGATQPYSQYANNGISAANAWNAGATQPYNQYANNGISAANAWNAGASQPYNQYHNAISQ